MSKLILVIGLTGAGKTTYCREISQKEMARVISIDRWMKALFWQDMPKEPDMQWFVDNSSWYMERIDRCESFIKEEIQEASVLQQSLILDLGFTSVSHRKTYLELAGKLSVCAEIHFLNVPKDERWKRVELRNQIKGETFSMIVSKDMFDYIEQIFEPICEDEKSLCSKFHIID